MAIEIWWQQSGAAPGEDGSGSIILDGPGPFKIGRGTGSHVLLDNLQVSREHVILSVDGRTVHVSDQGSQNGTLLDGARIETASWLPDQEMRAGPFTLRYRITDRRAAAAPSPGAHQPIPSPAPSRGGNERGGNAGRGRGQPAAAQPAPAQEGRRAFPGSFFENRVVATKDITGSGKVAGEVDYAAIGGGLGSFCWVDHLRIFGVKKDQIRVIGVASDKRPYAKYARLCRNSQIPDDERLRSNSISAPDNIWGFPGYASREMVADLLRGRLTGLKHVLQVFGEPAITESYTPRTRDVFRSLDREGRRIGWDETWLHGQVIGLRKTDDERYVIAYRVPSEAAPELDRDARERFLIARNVHIATGYPASNYLPDLQAFRQQHPDTTLVVNAYEEHDEVYRGLEARGGTVLIRGRGIVASRVLQRIAEARASNKDIRLIHLVRAPAGEGSKYDLARRLVRNDVEQQPFNWPKACWGGTLRKRLERASPEERAKLLATWGGTSTADRDDWNRIIEDGTREGWYKLFYGNVASISLQQGRVVTRLESSGTYSENVDLTADAVIDCTGLISRLDEAPLLADLVRVYDLARNKAPGRGAELRLSGFAVSNNFEIAGLQNGRGRAYASGVLTANGPYAAVDSFLGLQYAALRSTDDLAANRAPGLTRMGPIRSAFQWLNWCAGRAP